LFTGLIECTGVVISANDSNGIRNLSIEGAFFSSDLIIGDSVAVSGVCLTVTRSWNDGFSVEMMPETINNTVLGSASRGFRVNLERSMKASGRFEGHIVTGHVDTIAIVSSIRSNGRSREIEMDIDPDMSRYVARKGSVAVQGVSLTVIDTQKGRFRVGLIPKTLETTTFGELSPGSRVNIEFDIVSKYIEALLSGSPGGSKNTRTMDRLGEMGWV
jgi:riboflavin synthase